MKKQKPKEAIVVDKVLDMINYLFPQEFKEAVKKYQKTAEAQNCKRALDFSRGFLLWFLLKHRIKNGATPMEISYTFPLDYFTTEDKIVMKNFLNFRESAFEIKKISNHKKDYLIQDVLSNKKFLVKTLDLEPVLSVGDFVVATLVERLEGDYFFYGNIDAYSREEGLKVKKCLIEESKKARNTKQKRKFEVEWEFDRVNKNNG